MDNKTLAKKPMSQRKRVVLFVLLSALALVLCMGVVMGVALSMITDGVYEFETDPKQSLTAIPDNDDDTVAFLNKLTGNASDSSFVYVNISTSVGISDDTLTYDGSESEFNTIKLIKNKVLEEVDKLYPSDYTGKFDDKFTDYPVIKLSKGDYKNAVCEKGQVNDNGETFDDDYYFFSVTAKGTDYPAKPGNIYETFNLANYSGIADCIKDTTAGLMELKSAIIVPHDFKIEAKSDRFTDMLSYIQFTHTYNVTLTVTFMGDLESLGTKTLSFDYSVYEKYDYVWAGITCDESLSLEIGDSKPLSINAVLNDYSDYEVRFESSDEAVATVDEIGYVTALQDNEEPITVTVYLEYLGHEYKSVCEVNVRKKVEKIKISDDSAQLKIGENFEISASVKPRDATDKDIIWISDDESIACVSTDSQGKTVVTAKGEGQTVIRAVADDGNYQDLCTVTVSK